MPVGYRFDSGIVVIEMIGEYAMEDIRTTILSALEDSESAAVSSMLIDLSGSQSIGKRSSEDIRRMAHFVASLSDRYNHRIAFVAPGALLYGLVRMGSAGAEEKGIVCELFRSFSEAREWLLS
jgi:hypothetical protein